ncbi:hypothetical protein [Actinoplanes rectilineatus]|uniref:hypothetical protein n=1 Tax=Actinoplanes rectilineatus TaxID=113571 RepID=UPI000AA2D17C|nr:hypothetical protein [Actinoplanes rectilineatus]
MIKLLSGLFRLWSALVRLAFGAVFVLVGAFVFWQFGWPSAVAFTQPEAVVTVLGDCYDSSTIEGEMTCAATWTLDGAEVTGTITGTGLSDGTRIAGRVDGDEARVDPAPMDLLFAVVPLLFVFFGLKVMFTRGGRVRSGDGDDSDSDGGDGGGDGGGGGD